jgi:hypothetical protein
MPPGGRTTRRWSVSSRRPERAREVATALELLGFSRTSHLADEHVRGGAVEPSVGDGARVFDPTLLIEGVMHPILLKS